MPKIYVYQLKAIKNSNKGQLKQSGYITKQEDFADEKFEISNDSKTDLSSDATNCSSGNEDSTKISNITDTVSVKFYKSSLTDAFIKKSKRLPVLYASVVYNKPLITGVLMDFVVYFEFDTTAIKTANQLVNSDLEGKYVTEISIDNKKEFMPMSQFSTYNETAIDFCNLLKTDEMMELIKDLMNKRDEERRKKYGVASDFKIPVAKYKFDDIVKKYDSGMKIEDIMK